ncbi:MAG: TIR domain-containing protein [Acidiferrobacteraceae bacterium]
MARRIFFSFHYKRDINRAQIVQNHDIAKNGVEQSGYYNHSLWEETKRKGDAALQALIKDGLERTTVTVVLAGAKTYSRPWVRYELIRSFLRGNGLLTIYINQIKNFAQETDVRGPNPLDYLYFELSQDGKSVTIQFYSDEWTKYGTFSADAISQNARQAKKGKLSALSDSYDWVRDSGYTSFKIWIERAAKRAGR